MQTRQDSNTFILNTKSHIEALNELKKRHSLQLEEEKKSYQIRLSEQQGQIAKLMSDVEDITSDRLRLEVSNHWL